MSDCQARSVQTFYCTRVIVLYLDILLPLDGSCQAKRSKEYEKFSIKLNLNLHFNVSKLDVFVTHSQTLDQVRNAKRKFGQLSLTNYISDYAIKM